MTEHFFPSFFFEIRRLRRGPDVRSHIGHAWTLKSNVTSIVETSDLKKKCTRVLRDTRSVGPVNRLPLRAAGSGLLRLPRAHSSYASLWWSKLICTTKFLILSTSKVKKFPDFLFQYDSVKISGSSWVSAFCGWTSSHCQKDRLNVSA